MNAYKFQTTPVNEIIPLPKEFVGKKVEIIIREIPQTARKKSDLLLKPSMDTSNWKWSREEANER